MKINITETVLRDANQSLIATRMPYEDFEGILETMDRAGYYSLECWGGATFDSCIRYLNEDPWERLGRIRSKVKHTKLQMLLRGQNILGYKHYPDDVVREFIKLSADRGIDIIRIFDALNDLRNIEVAVDETLKQKLNAQGTIVYTLSPIHTADMYVKIGKELEDMGVTSICIKDMAGLMSPKEAGEIIGRLKRTVKVPIFLHTHCTTGLGPLTMLKAVEAGCDGIDTAISSFSGGTSQPPTETFNYVLTQMGYDTGLNGKLLKQINDFFSPLKEKYVKSGLMNPFVMGTKTDALNYQVPGGMLSNLISQLKQQNSLNRLDDVLLEIPHVRRDLGYPPLVTPMSQMVGTQSVINVLSGERYKLVINELKSYLKGEYGKAPGEINQEVARKILGDREPITVRYADLLKPGLDDARKASSEFARSEEDVMTYTLFPQIAENYLRKKYGRVENNGPALVDYTIEGL